MDGWMVFGLLGESCIYIIYLVRRSQVNVIPIIKIP